MAMHHDNILTGGGSSRALLLWACIILLGFLARQGALAFESFSSFTFGNVPGGEQRFNFNGFNPGGAGWHQGAGAVDNEGYYKVGVACCHSCPLEITGRAYDKHTSKRYHT